ncbi:MAG: isocitrate lyase/phosphoenolpyruvate mutase family protein [Marinosulfonomonas sp.]|nr:isocitrate lyase/phosphoenolpyruvate mutase family protein [Marinosulfonomonas sp.]
MTQAETFKSLHIKSDPVVLFNVWDAGTAAIVQSAGAVAIATGSWPVAAAQGFEDGEKIPLELMLENLKRIVAAVDLPVSSDVEGAYSVAPKGVTETVVQVVQAGAVGFNFEDQIVGGDGLHDIDVQTARVAAARDGADQAGSNIFINARTDLFLKAKPEDHAGLLDEALARALAYAGAGGDGFFAPGLTDEALIKQLCSDCPLPVNILALPHAPSASVLASLGVARISHGPVPYKKMATWFGELAKSAINYQ